MTTNKKLLICTLLLLTMFTIVGSVSASDSTNDNLATQDTIHESVSVDNSQSSLSDTSTTTKTTSSSDKEKKITTTDTSSKEKTTTTNNVEKEKTTSSKNNDTKKEQSNKDNLLKSSEKNDKLTATTLYVGEGETYTTIKDAVEAAGDGDTIFIKKGEYTTPSITLTANKGLSFIGEEKDKVTITGTGDNIFSLIENGSPLVFKNIIFTGIDGVGSSVGIKVGGDSILEISDCTFNNINSKYGAIQAYTTADTNIHDCIFEDISCSVTGGSGAIYVTNGNVTLNHCIFNKIGYKPESGYMYGVFYQTNGILNIFNSQITNVDAYADAIVRTSKLYTNIINTTFINNIVRPNPNNYNNYGEAIVQVIGASANCVIEQCNFTNNKAKQGVIQVQRKTGSISYSAFSNNLNVENDGTLVIIDATTGNYDKTVTAECNWYGSSTDPSTTGVLSGVTSNVWIVEDGEGGYELSNGNPLTVIIPGFNEPDSPEPITGITYFVTPTGNGNGSEDTPANLTYALTKAVNGDTIQLISEDDYNEYGHIITQNITIMGVSKTKLARINAGNLGRIFDVKNANVTFKYLVLSGAKASEGAIVYNNHGEITLDYVKIINNPNAGSLIYNTNTTYNVNIINSEISGHTGGNIITSEGVGNIIINNSLFKNNKLENYDGIIYLNSSNRNLIVENSQFINNTEHQAVLIGDSLTAITVKNSKFINNTNNQQYGGAIFAQNDLSVIDSVFINNKAELNGGAIYAINADFYNDHISNIQKSIFINNSAKEDGDAICISMSEANINNCIFLTNTTNHLIESQYGSEIDAENNYWGTNDDPNDLVSDDIEISKWAIMTVNIDKTELYTDDENNSTIVTVDLTKNNKGNEINLAEIKLTAKAENGTLNTTETTTKNNKATFKFTATKAGIGKVTINPGNLSTENINIKEHYKDTIYVSKEGNDGNNGSKDAPVATIAKAIELTKYGSENIIINAGTYKEHGLEITKNLTITGNGTVTINGAGEGRIFFMNYREDGKYPNKFSLVNLILTNATGYGAAVYSFAKELILDNVTVINNTDTGYIIKNDGILTIKKSIISNNNGGNIIENTGSGKVTISNTLFKNNNATKNKEGIISFSGTNDINVTIDSCQFINNTVKQSVIRGNSHSNIDIKNSLFKNNTNIMNGIYTASGGVISAQANLTVFNTTFISNHATNNGGAIDIGLNGKASITKSVFINNTADGNGDAISIDSKYDSIINYCVLLTNTTKKLIYNGTDYDGKLDAEFNWWGNNTPNFNQLVEGITVTKWAIMTVNPEQIDLLEKDSTYNITVTFTDNNKELLTSNLPEEIPVTANANIGELNTTKTIIKNNIAKFQYHILDREIDMITLTADSQTITIPVITKNIYDVLDELKELIEELNKTVNSQNITLTNLTQNNSNLKQDIEKLQKALSLNSTELQKALKTIENLEKNLDLNSTELQKALDTIKELNNLIQSQINNNSNFQKQIADLEAKLVTATTQINNIINQQNNQNTNNANAQTTSKTIKLTLKKVKSVKKSAKKLVITATLKKGKTALKNKKVIFTFNGKKYTRKTNKKGVARLVIKKAVLKKLKVGKKVKYSAKYGKKTVKRILKVKK